MPQVKQEILDNEIKYLQEIRKLYRPEPGFLDLILNGLHELAYNECKPGMRALTQEEKAARKYLERLSKEDAENIDALITWLQGINETYVLSPEELCNRYTQGYTVETGLPAWVKSTTLFSTHFNKLNKHENTTAEKMIIAGDIVKWVANEAEDAITTLRSANLLAGLSKDGIRDAIGAFNLLNVVFEFLKGGYDFIKAYTNDDKNRADLVSESAMRTTWSLMGVIPCILYIAKVLMLPITLICVSIVMIPVFTGLLIKDTLIYMDAKDNEEESSSDVFNQVLADLETEKENAPLNAIKNYQLVSMQHRKDGDANLVEKAKTEVIYTAIDLGAYFLIALASCSTIAVHYFTAPVVAIINQVALALTIIGVVVATVAKLYKAREAIAEMAVSFYEYCKEKLTENTTENTIEKEIKPELDNTAQNRTSNVIEIKLDEMPTSKPIPINTPKTSPATSRYTTFSLPSKPAIPLHETLVEADSCLPTSPGLYSPI